MITESITIAAIADDPLKASELERLPSATNHCSLLERVWIFGELGDEEK
jgi:hypothetical protein